MGRIKTKRVKTVSKEIFALHAEHMSVEHKSNKEYLSKVTEINSKKLRNIIAGMLTKLKKQEAI